MALRRLVLPGLVLVALVVTSVGWARSAADAPYVGQVDGCRWDGDTLVVRFLYGANEEVSPVLDARDGDLVVSLEIRSGGGDTPSIGLGGEASFLVFGDAGGRVLRPDGSELVCD
jgi:hypothetical protein